MWFDDFWAPSVPGAHATPAIQDTLRKRSPTVVEIRGIVGIIVSECTRTAWQELRSSTRDKSKHRWLWRYVVLTVLAPPSVPGSYERTCDENEHRLVDLSGLTVLAPLWLSGPHVRDHRRRRKYNIRWIIPSASYDLYGDVMRKMLCKVMRKHHFSKYYLFCNIGVVNEYNIIMSFMMYLKN